MLNELSPIENGRGLPSVGAVEGGALDAFVGVMGGALDVLISSPRSLELQAATMFRTEVSGDRGLRRAVVGCCNEVSGVRGSGTLRRGNVGSLGGGGGGSVEAIMEDLRGEVGRGPSFVGDAERDEVIEGTFEARGKELILSAGRVFEARVESPPGAEAEREGENIP